MIIAYAKSRGDFNGVQLDCGAPLPIDAVWIDMVSPTAAEESYIEKLLNINMPTREEMDKIEVMSPFYKEGNAYYMTITAIDEKSEAESLETKAITFIVTEKHLVTLRYAKPRAFSSFAVRAMRSSKICQSPEQALRGLVETMIHHIGEMLEKIGNDLDKLLTDVFHNANEKNNKQRFKKISNYNDIIRSIGLYGNFISKARESLVSLNRMLIFFGQSEGLSNFHDRAFRTGYRIISREVQSLSEYASFLSQRISFLLDATLGMISVEQNITIKMFTVAATVFMPPTLIASIYGMNFSYIPELKWVMGYPFALILIVLSGLLPYYFFKRKGWI
jgi:magnesium transporter